MGKAACLIVHVVVASVVVLLAKFYNGRIGETAITELYKWDLEPELTTIDVIKREGYAAEEHVLQTEDGYLLTMHRIPGAPGATPVLVQNGIITSSFDWVVAGKDKGLGFILADHGYDVWLGNSRGNTYCRSHVNYSTSDYSFWNFSWHEMGVYDVPAEINYITNATGQDIIFIGYSMGSTVFYVAAIERPDVTAKVKAMFGLAPIAFTHSARSPVTIFSPFSRLMEYMTKIVGTAEIFSRGPLLNALAKYTCSVPFLRRNLCANLMFSIVGFDPHQLNYTLLPTIFKHTPAGTSLKTFIHYYQVGNKRRFQYYDHGVEENLRIYNSTEPPDYNISKIQVPVGVFWSSNDYFATQTDVENFYKKLPKKILNYKVEYPDFNHADYMWAIDVDKYVYSKLVSVMDEYR